MKLKLIVAAPFALLLGLQQAALAEVSAGKVERAGPQGLVVSWTDKNPVDVYAAARPDAGVADAKLVSKADRDGRYEASDATGRTYFLLRDVRDGAVLKVAERALPLEQGSNFRDIGGYPAAGGKHVRWGRIFRSGGTPMLTDADVALVQSLGLKDLIDLRSSEERSLAPTRINGVRYSAVGYSMTTLAGPAGDISGDNRIHAIYRQFPTFLAPQLRILFRTLLADEGPVAYNCSAGQDRTGFTTAVVLSALGVPRDVIFADYHLSTTYRRPAFEMIRIDMATQANNPAGAFFGKHQQDPRYLQPQPLFDSKQQPLLEPAFAEIDSRWGSVEAYLQQEIGVSAADIARLRAEYLE